jgi:hypothetical protein
MTLTVRLEPQLEEALNRYCRRQRKTKSAVLTALLREHLGAAGASAKTPYELARQFGIVGSFASGKRDRARNYKRHLKEKLRAKHSR